MSPDEIREGSLSLIASCDGEAEEVGFTVTAFSTISSLSWDETPTKLPFSHKVRIPLSPPSLLSPGQMTCHRRASPRKTGRWNVHQQERRWELHEPVIHEEPTVPSADKSRRKGTNCWERSESSSGSGGAD